MTKEHKKVKDLPARVSALEEHLKKTLP